MTRLSPRWQRASRTVVNLALAGILLASLAGSLGSVSVRAQLDSAGEARVARATVLIVALVLELENGTITREHQRVPLGSGIIVSADGLILTNSHVIDLTDLQNDVEIEENSQGIDLEIEDGFLIYAVDGMDDAPDPRYSATIVIDQPALDLAVLSVSGNEQGFELSQPVGADRAPVVLSTSGAVSSRDPVQIFGYPVFGSGAGADAGSTTIDVVDGRVRSLETGPGIGNIELIHVDATVSGGSSGGAVVDEHGRLIGIVAQALGGAAGGSEAVAIPVNRARTVLSAAGWVEPPPTSPPTDVDTPEPIETPTPADAPLVSPTPSVVPTTVPSVENPEDAARFAELLTARNGIAPLAGPLAGDLTQAMGFVTSAAAGLTTADFSATATFVNPTELTGARWDFGFGFHVTANTSEQIVVDSNGNWYYSPFPEGTLSSGVIAGFNSSPGGTNTLDLMVEGNTALFGVNGQFLTRVDLSPAIPSDVQVGSGYFTTTVAEGRTIAYTDFSVWTLNASAVPVPTTTPVPPTNTPPPDDSTAIVDDAEQASRFADVLAARTGAEPLAGPVAGELVQDDGFIAQQGAGLTAADFSATASFVNPSELDGVSWDFGFVFHRTATISQRLVVDSNGNWYSVRSPDGDVESGLVPSFNSNPGATNTLDLVVNGSTALFGVNGQFVTELDFPDAVPSDIQVGSGYFASTTVHGRAIAYSDFTVWPSAAIESLLPTSTPLAPTNTPVLATSTPLPAVTPIGSPAPATDPTASLRFDALVLESDTPPVFGPLTGTLEEITAGQPRLVNAGVSLADFGAAVTFTNPETSTTDADIGFEFRTGADGVARNLIIVDSLGAVFASAAGGEWQVAGIATSYDVSPGATNTLQIVVNADEALVGVNDQFVAAVPLLAAPAASDVSLGSGFFSIDFVQGRVTPYQDFRVWELSSASSPVTNAQETPTSTPIPPTSTPAPTSTPLATPAPEIDSASARRFDTLLRESERPPDFGPFTGSLEEVTAGQVEVDLAGALLTDFGASVTFTNPDTSAADADVGFSFRTSADGLERNMIIVDSLGDVYMQLQGEELMTAGAATTYDTSPGATNTLQLFVIGDEALIGINDRFAGSVSLTAAPVASDVAVGSAFFSVDFVQDRVTDYEDFSVWEIPPGESPQTTATVDGIGDFGSNDGSLYALADQDAPEPRSSREASNMSLSTSADAQTIWS